jgi:RNA polymerase sigma-70 factor (ECF subfamily)
MLASPRRESVLVASNSPEGEVCQREFDALATTVKACQRGERDAQRRLYERCHGNVYRLAVRMVGVQDAADVTQNVFLQLFRKIGQFVGSAKFETWLYRLAVNESLQHLRKRSRWKFHSILHEPMSRERNKNRRDEVKEVLDQALKQLEPELRSIFVLREVEGLSYREIAESLKIPEGTVGSRLNRARRELRQHLADLGWEPNDELP